jgi:hypothetical protein
MKKASEYRRHAEECLALARGMRSPEQRDQLLKMAQTWNDLAVERERIAKQRDEFGVEDTFPDPAS